MIIYETADEAVAYMFYRCFFCFFCFFSVRQKIWDNRSRERLNGFSWNFYQTIPGKWSLKRRAAAWRMANVDDLRNLRYDSDAITRGRHARRLRYKIMSARMDLYRFLQQFTTRYCFRFWLIMTWGDNKECFGGALTSTADQIKV